MQSYLRQSTASQARMLGPFIDDGDFITPLTGLTIANTDIKISMNGAASADKNSGGGTARSNGMYGVTFDATDTATVGEMNVSVVVAGALPVWATFVVLEEVVFDMLFAASAVGYNSSQVVASVTGAVGSVTGAVGSVTGNVGGNVTGSVGSLATQAKADVNVEVNDVINVDTKAELSAVPAANASLGDKLTFVEMKIRNEETQDATEATISNTSGTPIATAPVSDNGTTFTKGKYA